jgi:hypothetical protein
MSTYHKFKLTLHLRTIHIDYIDMKTNKPLNVKKSINLVFPKDL